MSIVFIDFEASSLSVDSWPIEVGLAWIDRHDQLKTWSELIRPDPAWDLDDWSWQSETIHRIRLKDLMSLGRPAFQVAREFADRTAGHKLVSDAPPFDGRWMSRLFETITDAPNPPILDFDGMVLSAFDRAGATRVFESLNKSISVHRAENDAMRLARAWKAATMLVP